MHHVVPEFHVLDDFRQTEHHGARGPRRLLVAREEHRPPTDCQSTLDGDCATDIPSVGLPARLLDVSPDGVQLRAQRVDVGFSQVCVSVDIGDRHWWDTSC